MKKLILTGILASLMVIVLVGCSTKDKPEEKANNEVEDSIKSNEIENNEENDLTNTGNIEEDKKVEETTSTSDNKDKVLDEQKLTVGMFIPNGKYTVKYDASDLIASENYIEGDGASYQVIGTTGKGPKVDVYSIKYSGLYKVYSGDLSEDEMKDITTINYLGKENTLEEILVLNGPIKVGTRWDNKEIVEVGENLKLDNLTLEGFYVKTWEKEVTDGKETIKVCYYSEGLGCVKYKVLIDGAEVEKSIVTSITKE